MKAKSINPVQKQTTRIKSRDAVETAISIAKRATATRWDEVAANKGSRFAPWSEASTAK